MRTMTIMAFASALMITPSVASELRFDANGDGVMTRDEARSGVAEQLESADADHNSVWTHEEIRIFTDSRLFEVMFDADGDGTWSRSEADFAINTFTEAAMGCDGDSSGDITWAEMDSCAARTAGH